MKKYSFYFSLFFVFGLSFARAQSVPIITTIAGNGTPGYSGDGGPATAAQLKYPDGLAVDTQGNVYIGDGNHVVRKVTATGIISTFAGNDTAGYNGDGGPATAAKITEVSAIACDNKGNVYLFDAGNFRIRKIDTFGIITTIAGNGSNIVSGNGGPATAAGLSIGEGLWVDDTGNIYISAHEEVRKVDTFGIITAIAGNGGGGHSGDGGPATAALLNGSDQIAFDNNGDLYVYDNPRIRKISASGIINTVAGGSVGFSGDGGPATAALLNGTGIFPDQCGNFYIADFYNNRIRMVNDAGIITTIAGNGYGGVGSGSPGSLTGGYSGDGGPATAAELYGPTTVYLDKHGSIYFTDEYNHAVRYIKMDSCRNTLEAPPVLPKGEVMLRVYPNPNTGIFTVNVQSPVNEPASVSITNMVGVKVKEFTMMSNKEREVKLNVPAGVYFIKVNTAQGSMVKQVVVE